MANKSSGNSIHGKPKISSWQLRRAESLCREILPGISVEILAAMLTRHGADSAFVVGSDRDSLPTILSAAHFGHPLAVDGSICESLQDILRKQPFDLRHYVTCARFPVTMELLRRHFRTLISQVMAQTRKACCGNWLEMAIFPIANDPERRVILCMFSMKPPCHVLAMFAGAVRCWEGSTLIEYGIDANEPVLGLSTLQHRCMRWAAKGKTAADIAVIEGISASSVRYNLQTAKRSLKCSTLNEAIISYSRRFGVFPL